MRASKRGERGPAGRGRAPANGVRSPQPELVWLQTR
ncbi:hypothetical protein STAFG_4798 [Streptomyces afghaniensis 772]|uniref:Uncharacterized protein n=1 Tax=Streptomyces afghaniensis 772 TaxID=1283301 RepID=S4MNA2_9ACTN|nr:hypothetical protein STAFG_4798 [Streptomyces afghaniensis 772]